MVEIIADPKKSENFLVSSKKKEIVFDELQIHSKYARATSKNISIENSEKYARIKELTFSCIFLFLQAVREKKIISCLQIIMFNQVLLNSFIIPYNNL